MKASVKEMKYPALRLSAAVLVTVALAIASAGCGYTRQVREDVKPNAVLAMRSAQTLNPDAGKNRKVVSGLDGTAAKNVGTGYAKSFEKQEAGKDANTFNGTTGL